MSPIPEMVFIIPYRDREPEKAFFKEKMKEILEDIPHEKYRFFFIHQTDQRAFNRGAMKNIGFFVVRDLYPLEYRNITLIFHDVDTTPVSKETIPDYRTIPNVMKHFYGYRHAVGGICSIRAGDFEKLNGFPNYYSWGFEDNLLYERAILSKMVVDRSVFYVIEDSTHIRQSFRSLDNIKVSNRDEFIRFAQRQPEGLNSFTHLEYIPNAAEPDMIDVVSFETVHGYNPKGNFTHDVKMNKGAPFMSGYSTKKRASMNLTF